MYLLLLKTWFFFGLMHHLVAQNFHIIDERIASGKYDKRIRPKLNGKFALTDKIWTNLPISSFYKKVCNG